MSLRKRIGVVADDITGSNDIGVMLAKNGLRVKVISQTDNPAAADFADTDALVINTASRLDDAATAAAKSAQAASFFREMGCSLVYTKTCSVFRGNIGASFDAVQDVLGVQTSMVVAGFPRNGRTTLEGVHLLNGVPVAETAFSRDPVTPLTVSRLDELIGHQSARPCRNFTWEWLEKPAAEQRAHLEDLRREAAYVIFDVRDQEDLRRIAAMICEEPNICGSSAICEELPPFWGMRNEPEPLSLPESRKGTLILAGSLTPQTAGQAAWLEARGIPHFVMTPARLLQPEQRCAEVRAAAEAAGRELASGRRVLVYAGRDTDSVRTMSEALGIDEIEAGRRISLAFEELAGLVRKETGCCRYVVAGGETSDAVSRGLHVRIMRIGPEIEAGVPCMTAETSEGEMLALVFKSGSFGSPAFLEKAADAVQGGKAE